MGKMTIVVVLGGSDAFVSACFGKTCLKLERESEHYTSGEITRMFQARRVLVFRNSKLGTHEKNRLRSLCHRLAVCDVEDRL